MENDVKAIKRDVRKELSFTLEKNQKLTADIIRTRTLGLFKYWAEEKDRIISEEVKEQVIKEICDDFLGWGPLQQLMLDNAVTEIMVNGPREVYIEKDGKKVPVDVHFDDEHHLRYTVEKMLMPTGRRVDESYPFVDFSLHDGSRVNVIIPPLSVGGSTITVRKFLQSIEKIEDLRRLGTIDDRIAEFLVASVKAKVDMLFSGATGSGKTTTLEVLSSYIPDKERIITIEDALELKLKQKHIVRLLSRPPNIEGKGEISIRDLFINTLRMRPTRIILGEVRGPEAMDYLQALNSGHRGSLAVIHAASPSESITRLETMALYAAINLPAWTVRKQMATGLELIIQLTQLEDGSRKITYVTEVERLEGDEVVLRDIFRYEIEGVGKDGKVIGRFVAKNKPTFLALFKEAGIALDENIFKE